MVALRFDPQHVLQSDEVDLTSTAPDELACAQDVCRRLYDRQDHLVGDLIDQEPLGERLAGIESTELK